MADRRFRREDVLAEARRRAGLPPISGPLGNDVTVAVFDTWPMEYEPPTTPLGAPSPFALGRINAARSALARSATPAVARLTQIVSRLGVTPLVFDYAAEIQSAEGCAQRDCDGWFEQPYAMPDHGLFVADQVEQIAPAARLVVYRVLNDAGLGDLDLVARAVAHALTNIPGPLVLNLSLGFAPQLSMLRTLLANPVLPFKDPEQWRLMLLKGVPSPPDLKLEKGALGDKAVEALRRVTDVNLKGDRPIFAVAAAGNDSCRTHGAAHRIVGPRIPAAFEGVLGVGAITEAGRPASYSNEPDYGAGDWGVTAYGGEIDPASDTRTDPPRTTLNDHGMIGLYIAPDLAARGLLPDAVGLARWAGTSFATPVVAGFAAALWSMLGPNATPADLLRIIAERPGARPALTLYQR